MKQLKDYLYYYKEVPIIIVETSIFNENETIKTSATENNSLLKK